MEFIFKYERITQFLLSVVGVIVGVDIITKIIRFSYNIQDNYGYWSLLDIDVENSFGNFYSSVALLLVSIIFLLVAYNKKLNLGLANYWYGLAFIFCLFAFDEAIDIHEVISKHVEFGFLIHGPQGEAWLVPYLAFLVVFVLFYSRFLLKIPSSVRNGLIFATIIYMTGVAGFEVFTEWYEKIYGHGLVHALLTTVEDTFEMLGIILLIKTLLHHIEHEIGVLSLNFHKV